MIVAPKLVFAVGLTALVGVYTYSFFYADLGGMRVTLQKRGYTDVVHQNFCLIRRV